MMLIMTLDRNNLLSYFQKHMGLDTHEIDDETRLFSSGLLDSFSMVDLIFFIEVNAKIRVKPTEVNLDNLDSIQRILNFTQTHK